MNACGLWLVDGNPRFDIAAKELETESRKIGKIIGDFGVQPATHLVEHQRQVPVVQGDQWFDVISAKRLLRSPELRWFLTSWGGCYLKNLCVIVDAVLVDVVDGTIGQNPAPGQRQSVVVHSQFLQQLNILSPLVVGIARYVRVVFVLYFIRVCMGVPVRGKI